MSHKILNSQAHSDGSSVTLSRRHALALYVLASCSNGMLYGIIGVEDLAYLFHQSDFTAESLDAALEELAESLDLGSMSPEEADEYIDRVKRRKL